MSSKELEKLMYVYGLTTNIPKGCYIRSGKPLYISADGNVLIYKTTRGSLRVAIPYDSLSHFNIITKPLSVELLDKIFSNKWMKK